MPKIVVVLPVPDDALARHAAARAEVEAILGEPLQERGRPHVTLLYLGDVPEDHLQAVADAAVDALSFVRVALPISFWMPRALTAGDDGQVPVVIHANDGTRQLDGALGSIHTRLLHALAVYVAAPVHYPYNPHTTLGYLPRSLTDAETAALRESTIGNYWVASQAEVWADDRTVAVIPFAPAPREAPMTALHRAFLFANRDAPPEGQDEATRTRWTFVASEAVEDRYGDVVEQDWDLANYEKNPIVLWAHDGKQIPVGRGHAYVEAGCLMVDVDIDDDPKNAMGQLVAHQLRKGILNAGSVGFRGEAVARSSLPTTHAHYAKRGSLLRRNELLEYSIVPIPALPSSLAQRLFSYRVHDGEGESEESGKHPMMEALAGMLARLGGMPMSGDADDDYAMVLSLLSLDLLGASVGYLGVGKDADMRRVAGSVITHATARVGTVNGWVEARAAAKAGGAAAIAADEEPTETPAPPNYREGTPEVCCGTCTNMVEGRCRLHDCAVEPGMTCDDHAAAKAITVSAGGGVRINIRAVMDGYLASPAGQVFLAEHVEAAQETPRRGLFGLPK